jgi:methyltransferase-like protein
MEPRRASNEVREQLEKYSHGRRLEREQYMDFLKCRKFRQTLLCRADLEISDTPIAGRVHNMYATSPATSVASHPDLKSSRPEEFRGKKGAAMKTAHPLAKAAVATLTRMWPEVIHFEKLLARCGELIGSPADAEGLAEILLATYRAGLVELHVHPPACIAHPSEYPSTTALARWQARHGHTVTTLRHTTIEATGNIETQLLTLLDGTRDRAALAEELGATMQPPRHGRELRAELDRNLAKLAQFGLLIA